MNIKQIKLENFKNIKNSTILFKDNMSGIYGPNGTGKTAIIEAIEVLKKYLNYDSLINYLSEGTRINHSENFKNFLRIGESSMSIEIILSDKINDYRFSVTAQKDMNDSIYISEEKLSFKPSGSRKKEVNIANLINSDNSIIPEIILGKTKYLESDLKQIVGQNNLKQVISYHMACNSFFNFLYIIVCNREDIKHKSKEIDTFTLYFENIKRILEDIVILTLENQSLYQKDLVIPIQCSLDKNNRTINYSKNKNVYNKDETMYLLSTIHDISGLLSVIIPNSKLIVDQKIVGYSQESGKTFAINLFIEKNGLKVPLTSESTGTIKLISLLSVLISYIQNEKSTVIIDELDIHIFEYLLAVLLETISPLAKGQLIFTGHNLLPMERLGKDSIIIATKSNDDVIYTFVKGVSASTNIRQKYLKSQAYWSEDNIEPLMLNTPALELFVKKMVNENGN